MKTGAMISRTHCSKTESALRLAPGGATENSYKMLTFPLPIRIDGQNGIFSFRFQVMLDFSILNFYFPTFDFLRIVQHHRGPLEWLADIGGSLGLYLGASVFTLVEILWFFSTVGLTFLWGKMQGN